MILMCIDNWGFKVAYVVWADKRDTGGCGLLPFVKFDEPMISKGETNSPLFKSLQHAGIRCRPVSHRLMIRGCLTIVHGF